MEIKGLDFLSQLEPGKVGTTRENKAEFGAYLQEAFQKVNSSQLEAENLVQNFVIGQDVDLHEVVLATEKANLALQLTIQIKNKIIEAYQEIMRMQV